MSLHLHHLQYFTWMMINHSTFDRRVTFLYRSLGGPEWLFETLTLYSDPNPNPDPIQNKSIF